MQAMQTLYDDDYTKSKEMVQQLGVNAQEAHELILKFTRDVEGTLSCIWSKSSLLEILEDKTKKAFAIIAGLLIVGGIYLAVKAVMAGKDADDFRPGRTRHRQGWGAFSGQGRPSSS